MRALLLTVVSTLALAGTPGLAVTKNGFDLNDASVPAREIRSGGPPRDGIPALNKPEFIQANDARFLNEDDRVIGIVINGVTRAYPIKILNWHEIVNDKADDRHFVVTYCPLCGTGMVFASNVQGSALVFGVSGLLYNSDVLLFDRNTESLWSQIKAEAISGELRGARLPQLEALHTTWSDWLHRHPDTQVLSTETGYRRNYDRSPYGGYERSPRLYFQVANKAPDDFHRKALVLGVEVDGVYKAYPFEELIASGRSTVDDVIKDRSVTIHWNQAAQSAYATTGEENEVLPTVVAYWFAWYAFHPETVVFKAP
jgi:hypothetical protein